MQLKDDNTTEVIFVEVNLPLCGGGEESINGVQSPESSVVLETWVVGTNAFKRFCKIIAP